MIIFSNTGVLSSTSEGIPAFDVAIVIDMSSAECKEGSSVSTPAASTVEKRVNAKLIVDAYGCDFCEVNTNDPQCC